MTPDKERGPGYNGHESAGGLVYMRNRWYDPNTGRFTQEDPIGYAGGSNLYAYVGNNPVSFSDPFGLMACEPPDDPKCEKPPVPVPGAEPGVGWKWNPDPNNSRGGTWGPDQPIPGQSQPSATKDPGSRGGAPHWDVDDGRGNRQRYDESGRPITPEEAHGAGPSGAENPDGKGFIQKMSQLTGLTGAALAVYLIISEGSRLFPPRNLVPVP